MMCDEHLKQIQFELFREEFDEKRFKEMWTSEVIGRADVFFQIPA